MGPVEVVALTAPELEGPEADQFEIIGTKSTFRLAQRTASYVVLQYDRPVVKRKGSEQPLPSPAPVNVLDRSLADVSLLVDKFLYHRPLHHQRIEQAGITLSRTTLSNLTKRAIDLLRPIVDAQLASVRAGRRDMHAVRHVMTLLFLGEPLPPEYRDHELTGDWAEFRECHIGGDFLLIYEHSSPDLITFTDLGSHSELFE